MIEIAIPGEYFLDVPARLKIISTTEAVPKPTSIKPMSAIQNVGNVTAKPNPVTISRTSISNQLMIL